MLRRRSCFLLLRWTVKKTSKIAYGAVFSALCTVITVLGALIETFDASLAVIAGFLVCIALIEFETALALGVWLVSSVLSVVLFPFNSAAWMFVLFAGWYPIFKRRIERIHYVLAWAVKISAFNVSMFAYWFVFTKVLMLDFGAEGMLLFGLLLAANVVFVLYDIVMTRLITVYIFSWRNRLGFKN